MARSLLFALFAVSGFSGLIYESIWARYLKLFLGHAAYSRTLVLVIFMGGMAIGAWIAARQTQRWRNVLLGYAIVELLIGLAGAAFHPAFVAAMRLTFQGIIPLLGSDLLIQGFKWTAGALLILPQSILLGATFPLMSAAVVRRFPQLTGSSIAMLYFTNSIGGACGVLVAGFAMLSSLGLPGTVMSAGIINTGLALVVWLMSRSPAWYSDPSPSDVSSRPPTDAGASRELLVFLVLAGVTGAASLMYEIGWMRMLALVMGASTHAFELMLAAFIFGLAFGSLWIRSRIERFRDPVLVLGCVQVVMGCLALSTLAMYGSTFEWMSTLLGVLTKTEAGYVAFNVASHTIALLVMVPTTFCAGMTLPLVTHVLLGRGHGEGSIGRVYAANTVGAIVGVAIAVHLALPLVGLKGVIVSGAFIDVAMGVYIVYRLTPSPVWLRPALASTGAVALMITVLFAELDLDKMASGVFRHGRVAEPDAEIVFHRDGKTATVDVTRYRSSLFALRTNGKADASINMNPDGARSTDEHTQVLLAALPMAASPNARTAAVVGFGSGLTTHVLLSSPQLEKITTVEIEPMMVEGARLFLPRVKRAFEDPRSVIRIEDAKTFFASSAEAYDLIVSEPSNPWVSGVAGLFTCEFYSLARRSLRPRGFFCHWLHTYEIAPPLAASVMLALQESFPYYEIYN
ncbi:MAG: spermidine synthase, partial [Gammaproteobacteria bacterium]